MASKSFFLSCFFFVFALAMLTRGAVATRSVAVMDPYVATTQDDSGAKVIRNTTIIGCHILLLCYADGKSGIPFLLPTQAVHNANVTMFCDNLQVLNAMWNSSELFIQVNSTGLKPEHMWKFDLFSWQSKCNVSMYVTQGVCGPSLPYASGDGLVQLESNIKLVKQSVIGDTLTGTFVTTGFAYKPEL